MADLLAIEPCEEQQDPLIHLRYHKTLGIAVSGDVKLTRLEVEIIDSPDFQRLRRVQQLGPASWVYPTALHTRFDHSIGALKVADSMVTAIRESLLQVDPKNFRSPAPQPITNQQRILARLYALLHDIPHVPFGHTLEDELHIFGSHDDIKHSDGRERFERLLGPDSDIGNKIKDHLGDKMYQRFRNIVERGKSDSLPVRDYEGDTFDEFVYYLVSDTVCADLIDYLERDSFFCNLSLPLHKRFLDYLYVADVDLEEYGYETRRRVVVRLWKPRDGEPRRDIMTDMAGLLDSRYKLAERVYFHHTKIIVGTMIGRAVLEAKRLGLLSSAEMLQFGDQTLLGYLENPGDRGSKVPRRQREELALVSRLAKAVNSRDLHEQLHRYRKSEFGNGGRENCYNELIKFFNNADSRRDFEDAMATTAGVGPGDVLIYVAAPRMNKKIAKAVVDYNNEQILLKDIDDAILKARLDTTGRAHEELWNADILVRTGLTDIQKEIVKNFFEAQFMPTPRAETACFALITAAVANDNSLSNQRQSEVMEASLRAAKRLTAGHGRFGHNFATREVLLETLRSELAHSEERA